MTYKEELLERYRLARERLRMGVKPPVVPRPLINASTAPGGIAGGTGIVNPVKMPIFIEDAPERLVSKAEHEARSLGQLNSEVLQQRREEEIGEWPLLPPLADFDAKSKFNRWRRMVAAVAHKHQLSVDEILGLSRRRPVIEARFECAYRMRTELKMTYPCISRHLKRDHSTVIHGSKVILHRILDANKKRMQSCPVRTSDMVSVVADTHTRELAAA